MGYLISIDNGGTLTDACAFNGSDIYHAKALTTSYDLTKCFLEVLKTLSKEIYGKTDLKTLLGQTDHIRYSTTQGTNAVVERKGPRIGLIQAVGKSTAELRKTDDEADIFEHFVGSRVRSIDPDANDAELSRTLIAAVNDLVAEGSNRLVVSLTGNDLAKVENRVRILIGRHFPRHLLGAVPVLLSHEMADDHDDARRTWTAILNAFLHPAMEQFLYNAEAELREQRTRNPLLIFRNDGNSTRVAKTVALKTYSSGPRGGLAGTQAFVQHYGYSKGVMMDIGGTSVDIAVVGKAGIAEDRYGFVEDIPVSFPLPHMISVGAGGGSIFRVTNGQITVGPDSVGAAPGPACFGRGGTHATITDAYLVIGTLDPTSYFGGDLHLDTERAKAAIATNIGEPLGLTVDAAAQAMIHAYKAKIAQAIADHAPVESGSVLIAFGGAGPISACGIAEIAGFKDVLIPRMAAVFSAFGIGFSNIAHSYELRLNGPEALAAALATVQERAKRDMFAEGFELDDCTITKRILLVRDGKDDSAPLGAKDTFPAAAKGANDLRLAVQVERAIPKFSFGKSGTAAAQTAKPDAARRVLQRNGQWRDDIPVYAMASLKAGDSAAGPALIEDAYFTCRILDGWTFSVNENRDIVARRTGSAAK